MKRAGIVGAGKAGAAHARALQHVPELCLASVYDVVARAACDLARPYAIRVTNSLSELLESVEAVIIATPNETHLEIALAALERGCHILCEKPLASSSGEAEMMCQLASQRQSIVTSVGFNYRYLDFVKELERVLIAGELGEIRSCRAQFLRSSALKSTGASSRSRPSCGASSGALGDLGIHVIDLLHFVLGDELEEDSCIVDLHTRVGSSTPGPAGVDEHARVRGKLIQGAEIELVFSKRTPLSQVGFRLEISGSRGEFNYDSRHSLKRGNRGAFCQLSDPATEVPGWADSFRRQLHDWGSALRYGEQRRSRLATFQEGWRAQYVLSRLLGCARWSFDGKLASEVYT